MAFIRGKALLMALGLAVGLLALVACGSEAATPAAAARSPQGQQADLAGGSAALEALARGLSGAQAGASTGLWVSGQGTVSAVPDLALLNMGVEAFAGTVAEARSDGAVAMKQVLEVLQARGVADTDIQTRYFNISARYTTQEVTRCVSTEGAEAPMEEPTELSMGLPAPGLGGGPDRVVGQKVDGDVCVVERERVILGYDATNQLIVKIRDMESIGAIIDEVTEAGGDLTRFQGVSFTIEDTDTMEDEARASAIQDVMAKAERVASLAGVEVGDLIYLTESGGALPPPPMVVMERAAFADQAMAASNIVAGEMEVTVRVQAAFGIQQS